ncbi:hypothetical protein pb186bvf_007127 [Paramecium bursaria]
MKKDQDFLEPYHLPSVEDFQNDYDFDKAELLGAGTFGKVYKTQHKQTKEYHAVKLIEAYSQENYEQSLKELQLNRLINLHPNVINFSKVYAWQDKQPIQRFVLIFSMRLADGSLKDLIKQQKGQIYDHEKFLEIVDQLITTFEFLHTQKRLYHRDIKPENILYEKIQNKVMVRITDFGVSKALLSIQNNMKNTLVGTPLYLSPALWDAYTHNKTRDVRHNLEKSDVFSLGVTLIQTYLLLPDQDISGLNQSQQQIDQLLTKVQNEQLKHLFSSMLAFNEKQRDGWLQLLQYFYPDRKPEIKQISIKSIVQAPYEKTYCYPTSKIKLRLVKELYTHQSDIVGQYLFNQNIVSFTENQLLLHNLEGELQGTHQIQFKIKELVCIYETNKIVALTDSGQLYLITKDNIKLLNHNFNSDKIYVKHFDIYQNIQYMSNELILAGLHTGYIAVLDFSNDMVISLNYFNDHKFPIRIIRFDNIDSMLIASDEAQIISVRMILTNQITSLKLDYKLQEIQRIDEQQIAVQGESCVEILILSVGNDFKLDIIRNIRAHNSIPFCFKIIDHQCMICCTSKEVIIYDIANLATNESHLVLKELPLLFKIVNSENWGSDLIVTDKRKITRWNLEYGGRGIADRRKNKACGSQQTPEQWRMNLIAYNQETNDLFGALKNRIYRYNTSQFEISDQQTLFYGEVDSFNQIKIHDNVLYAISENSIVVIINILTGQTQKLTAKYTDSNDNSLWSIDISKQLLAIGSNSTKISIWNVQKIFQSNNSDQTYKLFTGTKYMQNDETLQRYFIPASKHNIPCIKFTLCEKYLGCGSIDQKFRIFNNNIFGVQNTGNSFRGEKQLIIKYLLGLRALFTYSKFKTKFQLNYVFSTSLQNFISIMYQDFL